MGWKTPRRMGRGAPQGIPGEIPQETHWEINRGTPREMPSGTHLSKRCYTHLKVSLKTLGTNSEL